MVTRKANETTCVHNGRFAIRSWGDVSAIALMLGMIFGVVMWGLKLEAELNVLRNDHFTEISEIKKDVASLQKEVDAGILPRADERIRDLQERIRQLEDR